VVVEVVVEAAMVVVMEMMLSKYLMTNILMHVLHLHRILIGVGN
jgi:hypothetical protein